MTFIVHTGDALTVLRMMAPESVQCVVTSPPYWGLRDYGVDGQIGLEPTLAQWLQGLVQVFAEVRRVLRNDGTCWVNMGDAYITRRNGGVGRSSTINGTQTQAQSRMAAKQMGKGKRSSGGLNYKDLIGQPWRLAFALQDGGWRLRRDIIWHKSNPMPESCTDRPTTAHEYLFPLSKGERYVYDAAAVRERVTGRSHGRGRGVNPKAVNGWDTGAGGHLVIAHNQRKDDRARSGRLGRGPGWRSRQNASFSAAVTAVVEFRNRRSVWTIPTSPYRGAHFATFPPKLVEPCILAGCPEGGLVLDPFAGSGTTGAVAIAHGRRFVGIELNPTYADLARERCEAARRNGRQTKIAGVA